MLCATTNSYIFLYSYEIKIVRRMFLVMLLGSSTAETKFLPTQQTLLVALFRHKTAQTNCEGGKCRYRVLKIDVEAIGIPAHLDEDVRHIIRIDCPQW